MPKQMMAIEDVDGKRIAYGEAPFEGDGYDYPYPHFLKYRGDLYQLKSIGVHEETQWRQLTYRACHPGYCRSIDHLWGWQREQWPQGNPEQVLPEPRDSTKPLRGEELW